MSKKLYDVAKQFSEPKRKIAEEIDRNVDLIRKAIESNNRAFEDEESEEVDEFDEVLAELNQRMLLKHAEEGDLDEYFSSFEDEDEE